MTIVLRPGESVAELLEGGACPACGDRLRPWGWARWRAVRRLVGEHRFRPPRVRCGRCGVTQVVLPPEVLLRRRDPVSVIGEAWRTFAGGLGARRVARELGLPMQTVRGWLRRLRVLAGVVVGVIRQSGLSPGLRRPLAAVEADCAAGGWGATDLWAFAAWRSQGKLLCNTSWPWPRAGVSGDLRR
jgi:hypothetical protein